jgi:hypothetical protein
LAPFILNNPDQHNDVQPRFVRVITVPDYFAEYREKGDGLAAFLGMSIVAKVCVLMPATDQCVDTNLSNSQRSFSTIPLVKTLSRRLTTQVKGLVPSLK